MSTSTGSACAPIAASRPTPEKTPQIAERASKRLRREAFKVLGSDIEYPLEDQSRFVVPGLDAQSRDLAEPFDSHRVLWSETMAC